MYQAWIAVYHHLEEALVFFGAVLPSLAIKAKLNAIVVLGIMILLTAPICALLHLEPEN